MTIPTIRPSELSHPASSSSSGILFDEIKATFNSDAQPVESIVHRDPDTCSFYATFLDEYGSIIPVNYSDVSENDFENAGPFLSRMEAQHFCDVILAHGEAPVQVHTLGISVLRYWAHYQDGAVVRGKGFQTVEEAKAEAERLQAHFQGRSVGYTEELRTMGKMCIDYPFSLYTWEWEDGLPNFK